jgi:diguanylate cyclase (GGDEF)-like protein
LVVVHFLRFTAYSIALRFVLLTYRRLGERLTEAKWAEEALHEREVGLQYLAYHDTLTGLPNRALLLDRLERALAQAERYNQLMALLYLDLDHFKRINDALGHGVGDELLKEVAARLSSALREEDTVVRLGGDEFLIILPRIFVPHDATPVAEKVTAALSRTFVIHGHELHVTASIGISVYPKDGRDKETLMEHADAALYQAKEAGRNTYQFFNRETNAQAQERSVLENALRAALEGGELVLHYQPQVDLQSRTITGLEALVRWRHPELGIVPPSAFISIAEESGLITPIGEWIVRNACLQTRTWQEKGLPRLRIAVLVSTRQLRYGDLPAAISRILEETGLEPPCLEIELAESSLIIDPAHAAEVLTRLHAMGVQLALDDFGTGYSSLVYLKRFPFRRVRIAGSLVRDLPQDPAMVQAILALARQFGMKVVAKGVETEEQRALLQAYACDEVQGPRFSPPVTAEAVLPLFGK